MRPTYKGALYLVLAMFAYSAMSALVKVIGPEIPSIEVVFFRALCGLPLLFALAWRGGISLTGTRRGLLLLRGIAGTSAMICFFFALQRIPVANALLLNQLSAVFILPLAALFLKEQIGWRHVVLVLIALLGVAVILKPRADIAVLPSLVAVGSAVLAAIALTVVRKLASSDNPLTVVFWFSCMIALITGPLMLPVFVWPSWRTFLLLAAMGLIGTLGQVWMTQAYRYSEAGRVAVIGSMGAVFGVGWDVVLWGQFPDKWTIMGGILVIVACTSVQRLKHQK